MGTRNLICVVKGGEYKVAQYGQWDGYPSGQGATVLQFLREQMNRELFLKKLDQCRYVTGEEFKALWVAAGANPHSDMVSLEVSNRFKEANPQLSRDTGGYVLQIIQDAEGELLLRDSLTFAADSLFCEYAYVVDLDKGTFEVFRGFNHAPLAEGERFAFLDGKADQAHRSDKYTPIKHWHTFQLDALPTMEEFLALLEPNEDEEE